MLMDIAATCKQQSKTETATKALLSISLAWAHVGEHERACHACAEADAASCSDATTREVLDATKVHLGLPV